MQRSYLCLDLGGGGNALFARAVLYILCTALVTSTLQLQQVKAPVPGAHFWMSCPPGLESSRVGAAEVASGPGRTATATGACSRPTQSHKPHLPPLR